MKDTGEYFDLWADGGRAAVLESFEAPPGALTGAEVLVATYSLSGYDGSTYVLFRRDGKLFEVHGGHCSCYGLEGQWTPEEVTPQEILFRMDKGTWGEGDGAVADSIRAAIAGKEPGA